MRLSQLTMFLAFASSAAAQQPEPQQADPQPYQERRGISLVDRLVVDGTALDHLPSNGSISNVMSRVLLPPISSLEESMGYSDIEPERMTIVGNSALWTQWRLEGLNISDPFFDGAAAFKVPFVFLSEIELVTSESPRHPFGAGVLFGVAPSPTRPTRAAKVSFGIGGVGGTMPFAERISDFITTAHARSRATQPEEDRRRLLGRLQASLLDTETIGRHTLRYAVEVDGNARHQNEFPTADRAQASRPFTERSLRVSGIAELAPEDRSWRAFALGEYRQRDNLFIERRFSRGETHGLSSGGLMLGFVTDSLRAGLTFKHDRLTPVDPAFSRELLDVDGEGPFPFIPGGAMNSARLDLSYRKFDFYVASDTRLLAWSGSPTQVHPLTFEGAPVGSMTVESRATTTVVGSHRLGYSRSWVLNRFELAVDGYALVNHANALGTSSALVFPDVGAEVQGVLHLRPWFQPFLTIGKTPISISSQNALVVTPGHLTATERLEDGRLVQTLGADFSRITPGLRAPNIYSVVFGFSSQLGEKWKLTLQGIAKAWHSLSRLTFDGAPQQFGHFTNGVFFFDGAPTRYTLVNDPFGETPYGGMVQLQVARRQDENGFFDFSFSAANFFGHPPIGNGAFGNDIGLVDWLGANPNARYRSLSNTDADRAFILKLVGGKRLWRTLWGSFGIFYKDGQPFGFSDSFVENGQVVFRRNTNRGSAMQISSPLIGWREDYQIEVDLRVSYDVALSPGWNLRAALIVANVLDLGNEVSERHGPPFDRSSLELQLPRSLNFSVELIDVPRATAR
jgi:hypothetical protein